MQWFNLNPRKTYDDAEILAICKLTTLTYPEIAALEGIPVSAIIRICAKQTKRTGGRPKHLTKEEMAQKISQVINFYKKTKQPIEPLKLDRFIKFLTEKVEEDRSRESQKGLKRKTIKKSTLDSKKSHELALVIDFLVEKYKKQQQNIVFTMAEFVRAKHLDYDNFLRVVRRNIKEAWAFANEQISRFEKFHLEEKYRLHVINYLASQELLSQTGQILNKLNYVEQNGLDYSIFLKYFRQYRASVKDEVLIRYRELEEERLHKLRKPILEESKSETHSEIHPISLLEKIALKKLPTKKGHVVFSTNKVENSRLEDIWLQIAEDVSHIGLIDPVAQKWQHEINLPPSIPLKERNRLILLRIDTVLKQLDMFMPPRTLSFEHLNNWLYPATKKEILEPVKPVELIEPILEVESESIIKSPFDERWLEQEIAKEELETRRFLDSQEERDRRKREGLVIFASSAQYLNKVQLEQLKNTGAIYANGDWLLPIKEDLDYFNSQISIPTQSVEIRKPKLLVGTGTSDYTKEWMYKVFNVKVVSNDVVSFRNLTFSFEPDALMVYKSSCSRNLYEEAMDLTRKTGIPLLIFDRGFADVLLSAEKQNIRWFIDAYQRRKSLRRRNPFYQYRRFLNY